MARLPPALEQHFRQPWRGAGPPAPRAGGEAENPSCGDWVQLELSAAAGATQVRMAVRGCSATIAVASLVASRLDGQPPSVARRADVRALVDSAGGLSQVQQHATAVVERALAAALASIAPT